MNMALQQNIGQGIYIYPVTSSVTLHIFVTYYQYAI